MKAKKIFISLSVVLSFLFCKNNINAALSDPMNYEWTIYANQFNHQGKGKSVSYKYYAGTSKQDKSAYVISGDSSNKIKIYHYITDKNFKQKSECFLTPANLRMSFPNNAPKDTSYGSYFLASRQNWWDLGYTIKGSWSADDRLGK